MARSVDFRQAPKPGLIADSETTGSKNNRWPSASVVIPCFNEQRFISSVLENLARQYDRGNYEIIVVDGMSTDRTRQIIEEFATSHPELRIRIVDNPARNIPTALNLGIAAATGEIIVRMDAHSVPTEGYVRRCVEHLNSGSVSVVGMPWRIKPGSDSLTARAIALAVAHPFGIGDAQYRLQVDTARLVDTVPFGAFRKSLWTELGGYNEELLANEDYDFNYRVRKSGGQILLDPAEHCEYYARVTLAELATQYARYGHWKAQMIKLHPRSIKVRHLVAPAFVLSLFGFGILSILSLPASAWMWSGHAPAAFLLILGTYLLCSIFVAVVLAVKAQNWKLVPFIVASFLCLHVAWGSSFLRGLFTHKSAFS
ncbi:MAG TPA: glycosyltransferase family 2 protein [Pyrinomonadaceae bacterium]|nr:glycosyltransferase family 2 protein [Pyrinomonadaceae bacterium]